MVSREIHGWRPGAAPVPAVNTSGALGAGRRGDSREKTRIGSVLVSKNGIWPKLVFTGKT